MPWMGGNILSIPFVYCFLVVLIVLRTALSSLWSMGFFQCVGRVASGAADQAFRGFMYIIICIFTIVAILPHRRKGQV